jgi:hypothetical protein
MIIWLIIKSVFFDLDRFQIRRKIERNETPNLSRS